MVHNGVNRHLLLFLLFFLFSFRFIWFCSISRAHTHTRHTTGAHVGREHNLDWATTRWISLKNVFKHSVIPLYSFISVYIYFYITLHCMRNVYYTRTYGEYGGPTKKYRRMHFGRMDAMRCGMCKSALPLMTVGTLNCAIKRAMRADSTTKESNRKMGPEWEKKIKRRIFIDIEI